ncbi:MAG: PAS domain-containing protein [Bacteroidales bacterium]
MSNSKSIHLSRNKNIPGTTIFRRNDSIPPWKDLSAVFNALDDYLFVLDQEANIIFCNENVFEQLGYSKKDLIGENLIKVHPAQLQEEVASSLSDMLTGKEKLCNVPLLTKNGKEIPVETRIISWNWEGMDVLIGISRNISERLAYEHQIRENSERLQMALLATDAGLWDWDIKTGNLVFNEKWFALRGYDSFELENKYETWKSQVYPDDQKNVLLMLNKHLHHGTPFYQAEYRTKHKNGDYIWILDTGRVTEYDAEGKPVRMVGTNIDINDKKQSELLLKQNLRQQELLSEIALEINSLESFSSRISSILKKIGEHTGVSRVYIFENKCETTSNTFEWCNHGVTPQINDLQEVPFEAIPSWISILNEYGLVYSENIAELPEDLKIVLEPQGIKSIIVYPLTVKKSFFGFIGFDECVRPKHWTKSELELLRTVSGIIANAFERKL